MREPLATIVLWLVFLGVALLTRVVARALRRELPWREWFLFLVLPILFLAPGFFRDRTPIPLDHVRAHFAPWNSAAHPLPHNPSLSDVATQFAPWAKAVRMAWKEGSLPLWNRWNGCGMPLAASGQSQAFSPFLFLTFVLPLARGFVLLGAVKLLLASIGTFLWLRELGVSGAAARFGAVTFAFSFALTAWLYHPATSDICLWPWALFGFELLADPAVKRRALVFLVLVLTAWPLGGHLETVALGALFGALWFGLRAFARDLPSRAILKAGSLAGLAAIALAAFALLPQLYAVLASNRLVLANDPSHLDYVPWVPYKPGWLGGFLTSLFPTAYGDLIESPMIPGAAGSIVEMGFGYFGVLGWSCALLVLRPGSRRSWKEWILFAILLLGLCGAMGLPVFRSLIESIPGIRLAPPLRLLLFASMAGAPLAALELDRLTQDVAAGGKSVRFFVFAVAAIAGLALVQFLLFRSRHAATGGLRPQVTALFWTLAVLSLAGVAASLLAKGRLTPALFLFLITGLSALELLHQGMRLYRFYSPGDLYPETPLIGFLRAQNRPLRIVSDEFALYPNTNIFASMESVLTHDPAERRDYVQLLDSSAGYARFDYFKRARNLDAPIFDFANVRFLVSSAGGKSPGSRWVRVYAGADGQVFENRRALPRLYAPPEIEIVDPSPGAPPTGRNALPAFGPRLTEFLAGDEFARRAILLKNPSFAPARGLFPNPPVRVGPLVERTNTVRFEVSVSGSSRTILVSSLVSDGGWSARDEAGTRIPVGLANGPFLALGLPPGQHRVTLAYTPPGFRLGATVSLFA
ncbi:MAG TPA: YfhO family protein, partial [Thermoanaerobaculia bacterium]|nr:YfhO family protein [Thermoanaerobaculia bacterium]